LRADVRPENLFVDLALRGDNPEPLGITLNLDIDSLYRQVLNHFFCCWVKSDTMNQPDG
jgi:hypothetical protein